MFDSKGTVKILKIAAFEHYCENYAALTPSLRTSSSPRSKCFEDFWNSSSQMDNQNFDCL
jgi:hypothetical protein